jgi:hypothetical protein
MATDKDQNRRIKTVEECIETLNHNSTDMCIKMAKVTTDVAWLKRFFFIIATASIGSLVATLIQLATKR